MKMKGILALSGVVVLGLFVLLLSACTNPATSSSQQNTISGTVRNTVTGAAIPNATIVMGSYTAKTNSSGQYMITLGSGETTVTGALAVSDGTTYGFDYIQAGTVNASSNPSNVDAMLVPAVTPTASVTLSGTITDGSGTALPSGSEIQMAIVNQNGGSTSESSSYGSSYTISTATTGSDCFVAVSVTYPSGSAKAPFVFYLKNQNITASNGSYDLTAPSATPTTVSLSGETVATGASFGMAYDVPSLGSVIAYSAKTDSSTVSSIDVYDPDNYQVEWGGNVSQTSSSPVIIKFAFSAAQALAASQPIPAFIYSPTTSYDDVTSGSYSGGTLTFTTSSDTNVNAHLVQLIPEDSSNKKFNKMMGILWLQNGSVTLPASIQTVISSEIQLTSGNTWGIAAFAAKQSGLSPSNIFGFIQTFAGSGLLGATDIQLAAAADTNSVNMTGFIK